MTTSGVGVLDKSAILMAALEIAPQNLGELVGTTGLPRPTVHRLAAALMTLGFVERDESDRYELGPRLTQLSSARGQESLIRAAGVVLVDLRDRTGESAQLFRRVGTERRCVAVADRSAGLRDTVPLGATLPMTAGSAAQVLLAWEPDPSARELIDRAAFDEVTLAVVRERGWAESVGEREPGVSSVSVPVHGRDGRVIAAMSVSGPAQRFTPDPGARFADHLLQAARGLESRLFKQ